MTAVVLTMPDESENLAPWLDRQLVGRDLTRLMAELAALHGPAASPTTLDSLLAGSRKAVLGQGLAALPRPQLQRLLRQPDLLEELQDLVFAEGGSYWDSLGSPPPEESVNRVTNRVHAYLALEPATLARTPWYRRTAVAIFATAAAVLLAVFVVDSLKPRPSGTAVAWGWGADGGIPRTGNESQVYQQLSAEARKWFNKRPETPEALSQRLGEFRQGCSALLLDRKIPLSTAERSWLDDRCRAWAAAFDDKRRQLETTGNVLAVRAEMDETVNGIVRELDERARRVGRG